MQKISLKKFIPGTTWFFIILLIICLPGKDVPEVGWLSGIANADKIIHLTIFGVLVGLFCWPFYRSSYLTRERIKYFIGITIAVSVLGLITEIIQKFFISGRSFDLLDWGADSLGALLAFWFCSKKFSKT